MKEHLAKAIEFAKESELLQLPIIQDADLITLISGQVENFKGLKELEVIGNNNVFNVDFAHLIVKIISSCSLVKLKLVGISEFVGDFFFSPLELIASAIEKQNGKMHLETFEFQVTKLEENEQRFLEKIIKGTKSSLISLSFSTLTTHSLAYTLNDLFKLRVLSLHYIPLEANVREAQVPLPHEMRGLPSLRHYEIHGNLSDVNSVIEKIVQRRTELLLTSININNQIMLTASEVTYPPKLLEVPADLERLRVILERNVCYDQTNTDIEVLKSRRLRTQCEDGEEKVEEIITRIQENVEVLSQLSHPLMGQLSYQLSLELGFNYANSLMEAEACALLWCYLRDTQLDPIIRNEIYFALGDMFHRLANPNLNFKKLTDFSDQEWKHAHNYLLKAICYFLEIQNDLQAKKLIDSAFNVLVRKAAYDNFPKSLEELLQDKDLHLTTLTILFDVVQMKAKLFSNQVESEIKTLNILASMRSDSTRTWLLQKLPKEIAAQQSEAITALTKQNRELEKQLASQQQQFTSQQHQIAQLQKQVLSLTNSPILETVEKNQPKITTFFKRG